MSCWSFGPRVPSDLFFQVKLDRTSETSVFCSTLQHHCIKSRHMNQAGTRLSGVVLVSFWLSGEVKHIVHLIRWTLEAVYALVADWNTVPVQGTIGTESWS